MLIVFCVERPSEEGTPLGGECSYVAVLFCVKFEKFVEY